MGLIIEMTKKNSDMVIRGTHTSGDVFYIDAYAFGERSFKIAFEGDRNDFSFNRVNKYDRSELHKTARKRAEEEENSHGRNIH